MSENGIELGNKGRNYVCRRLLRRMLRLLDGSAQFDFEDWLRSEQELRDQSIRQGRRLWRKHKDKPHQFW